MPPLKKHVWAFADGNKWDQRKVKNDTKWSSNNSTGKRKQSENFQYKVECKTKSITDKNKANLWLATPPHDQFFVFQLHYPSSSQRERNKRRKQKSTREIMWLATSTYVHQVSDAQPALWKGIWQQICALSNPVPNLFLTSILNLIFPKPTLFWYKKDLFDKTGQTGVS